jgi:hypothetical protein
MAGAGYKLFNTGDVLTAAQVNTYLMEQTVMVFADAAARTTALTGVVSEGMLSYLKSTKQVEVYNGSAWVASDDPNAIQNTIVDAKGDLIAATANDTPARLAVGSNGDTLVADSAATTGLRWQSNFAAGKNKVINGDFGIWQRGTSFTPTSAASIFTTDRFQIYQNGSGSFTCSQQTFTPGAAPVAGYESQFFHRIALTTVGTTTAWVFNSNLEDVRTFAGQTVTLSFWAKGTAATIGCYLQQNFGSGGSSVVQTGAQSNTLTTSWQRFSYTVTLPSISGKTIGAGSSLSVYFGSGTVLANTSWDIWGVQLEAGNVATAFQTATGTLQGEIALCQRYYFRLGGNAAFEYLGQGMGAAGFTGAVITIQTPVTLRTSPSAVEYSTIASWDTNALSAVTAVTLNTSSNNLISINVNTGASTAYRPYFLLANNSTAGYVAFSAEL